MGRCVAVLVGLLTGAAANAEPARFFGGELAIEDGISGTLFDVNADGRFDIVFAYFGTSVNSIFAWDALVFSAPGNGSDLRLDQVTDENDRSALVRRAAGDEIGPAVDGGSSGGAAAYESFFDGLSGGPWLDQKPGFVGFSFLSLAGERHYAWAEIRVDNVDDPGQGFLVLTGIGWETTPGTPIEAGAPAGGPGCNAADLAEAFGVLDLADIVAFVSAFGAMEEAADLAEPFGVYDLADVVAFVEAFNAGCP